MKMLQKKCQHCEKKHKCKDGVCQQSINAPGFVRDARPVKHTSVETGALEILTKTIEQLTAAAITWGDECAAAKYAAVQQTRRIEELTIECRGHVEAFQEEQHRGFRQGERIAELLKTLEAHEAFARAFNDVPDAAWAMGGPSCDRLAVAHAALPSIPETAAMKRIRETRKEEPAESAPKSCGDYIAVVFDGPPSHESGRFVEVERDGRSINAGEWVQREDKLWELRIPDTRPDLIQACKGYAYQRVHGNGRTVEMAAQDILQAMRGIQAPPACDGEEKPFAWVPEKRLGTDLELGTICYGEPTSQYCRPVYLHPSPPDAAVMRDATPMSIYAASRSGGTLKDALQAVWDHAQNEAKVELEHGKAIVNAAELWNRAAKGTADAAQAERDLSRALDRYHAALPSAPGKSVRGWAPAASIGQDWEPKGRYISVYNEHVRGADVEVTVTWTEAPGKEGNP